jgi:hypothetical protein
MVAASSVIKKQANSIKVFSNQLLAISDQAIFQAIKDCPDNTYCQQILKTGLVGVIEMESKTPKDVCEYMKTTANTFGNDGAGNNIIDMLERVSVAKASWDEHRTANRISALGCPSRGELRFEKLHEAHILKHFGREFKDWECYQDATAFMNVVDKSLCVYQEFKQCFENRCDFLHPVSKDFEPRFICLESRPDT